MKILIVALCTFILTSNLVFAQGYDNEIYNSSVIAVQNKLQSEKDDLDQINVVLEKLKNDLKSAKTRRNISLGIGIPVGLFTGFISISALMQARRPTNSFFIELMNIGVKLVGVLSGGVTLGMGTYIWLSQNKVNQIQKHIDQIEQKIVKRKEMINIQIKSLQN